jgi:hypothetical protein
MRSRALVIGLVIAALAVPCFAGALRVTADLSADFMSDATTQTVISTFSVGSQPLLWGVGWEIVPDKAGFGGNLAVSFFQDAATSWWLDWVAPGVFLSYHPFGAERFLDPFIQVGAGCAGRVGLGTEAQLDEVPVTPDISLSLYPFAAAGLAVNLDGLLLQAKVTYTPYNGSIPVTDIATYPLGKFQVALSGGLAATW